MHFLANRDRSALLRRYRGRNAEKYEAKRQGPMWAAEAQAFQRLFDWVQPASVLDCPLGTGRWIGLYQKRGASVVGLDLSGEMLTEAARKVSEGADVRFSIGDLLQPGDNPALRRCYDLVVCTRFLHWLRQDEILGLLGRFQSTGSRFLIISAFVGPNNSVEGLRLPKHGWARWKRLLIAPWRRHAPRYIHKEHDLLRTAQNAGWKLVEKCPVMGHYYYYLLVTAAQPFEVLMEGR